MGVVAHRSAEIVLHSFGSAFSHSNVSQNGPV